MRLSSRAVFAAAGLASSTLAALATYSPVTNGPTYQVGVPAGSSISSSSPGTIYFSLSAPTSYEWVGLGIGTQMAGSHIFVMYANGDNVTLSARDGQGLVEPLFDSSLYSGIELLEGSGISNGVMTANVRCTTCTLDSSATSSSSPWICAWYQGKAAGSSDLSYTLPQHDFDSTSQFTFDLSAASLSSDTNPFVSAATSSAAAPSGTSTPSGTSASSGTSAPSKTSGSSPASSASPSSSSSSANMGSSSSTTAGPSQSTIEKLETAHGSIMAITFVLLFPIGSTYMRVFRSPSMHGFIQLFSVVCMLVGFGLGVKLAQDLDILYTSIGRTHTIFGTAIIALFIIQPFLGVLHHYKYMATGGRTAVSHLHIWYGRIIMALGDRKSVV